jgi:hypothetical protein
MATQIWQHLINGERFAVETDEQGVVVGAAGPLDESEVELAKAGDWVADRALTEILKETAGQYRDVTSNVEYN